MPKEKKKLSGKCLGVLAFGWCLNHFTASKLQNQKSATCGLQTTNSPTPALLGANAPLSLGHKRIEPSTAPHNDENNDSEPPPRRKVKGVGKPTTYPSLALCDFCRSGLSISSHEMPSTKMNMTTKLSESSLPESHLAILLLMSFPF